MIVLAHIMGVPVEEFLIPWASGSLVATLVMVFAIVKTKALDN